jgi:hypothetical protein
VDAARTRTLEDIIREQEEKRINIGDLVRVRSRNASEIIPAGTLGRVSNWVQMKGHRRDWQKGFVVLFPDDRHDIFWPSDLRKVKRLTKEETAALMLWELAK